MEEIKNRANELFEQDKNNYLIKNFITGVTKRCYITIQGGFQACCITLPVI